MNPKSKNIKIIDDKHKKPTAVILKYQEFEKLMEELEDLHDVQTIYTRTSKPFKTVSFEVVLENLSNKA